MLLPELFSSPIGESIFSTKQSKAHMLTLTRSRPLSGNLFSLPFTEEILGTAAAEFSSPIGESIFSTAYIDIAKSDYKYVLVPYRGIYFLYRNLNNQSTAIQSSRPLSGNLFSLLCLLISFIFCSSSSRPLSGNLFSLRFS